MPKTKNAKVEKLEKDLAAGALVDSAESLELLIQRVLKAQRIYATYSQEKVDAIFKAVCGLASFLNNRYKKVPNTKNAHTVKKLNGTTPRIKPPIWKITNAKQYAHKVM